MKSVVVSGGCGQFGQAIMRTLIADYRLIVLARPGGAAALPPDLAARSVIIEADLSDGGVGEQLVEAFSAQSQVAMLINAAADTDFHMFSHEVLGRGREATDQLVVNVIGPAVCAAALFESQWKDRPLGRTPAKVLNISSISGRTPFFGTRQCFYAASKAALNMLTLYMAREYEPFNINVNALSPSRLSDQVKMTRAASAVRAIVESNASGKIFDLE